MTTASDIRMTDIKRQGHTGANIKRNNGPLKKAM